MRGWGGEASAKGDIRAFFCTTLWIRRDLADVCHGIPLFHGRHTAYIEDYSRRGRFSFIPNLAKVVRHISDFHSLLDICSPLHQGIENAWLGTFPSVNFPTPHRLPPPRYCPCPTP